MYLELFLGFFLGGSVALSAVHFLSPQLKQKSDTVSWDAGFTAGVSRGSVEMNRALDQIKVLRSPISIHDIETIVRKSVKKIEAERE